MSADQTRWLEPFPTQNPNIPQDTRFIQLDPIYLVPFSALSGVLVFEAELDVERLAGAVAELASWYPHLAGRYVSRSRPSQEMSDFAIELTSSLIPLELGTEELDGPYPFPNRDVVQPSIAPYAPSLESGFDAPNSGVPLFAVRHTLTLPHRYSVLGLTISHTLADAASCCKLQHDLAFLYRYPGTALPEPPHLLARAGYRMPTMEEMENSKYRTQLLVPTEKKMMGAKYVAAMEETEPVTFKLSREELSVIAQRIRLLCKGFVSEQDALSGWWIEFLERMGEQVRTLTYIMNYRTLHSERSSFPPELQSQYSTVAQVRDLDVSAPASSQGHRGAQVAQIIRAQIDRFKASPDETLEWIGHAAHWHEIAAKQGKGFDYIPGDGVAIINSNLRYDWTPDFGLGRSSYHTVFSERRFLRVFRQNPSARDGLNTASEDAPGGVELVFRVAQGSGNCVHAMFDQEKSLWNRN